MILVAGYDPEWPVRFEQLRREYAAAMAAASVAVIAIEHEGTGAPSTAAETNAYVIAEDSLALRNHLAVRDTLRADPALRE